MLLLYISKSTWALELNRKLYFLINIFTCYIDMALWSIFHVEKLELVVKCLLCNTLKVECLLFSYINITGDLKYVLL